MFQPGDLLLVSRRRTLRSFLAGPVTFFVSWRIQATTDSKWNHVACAVNNAEVVEAEFLGVTKLTLESYFRKSWKYEFARYVPADIDGASCADFWRDQIGGKYDFKWILAIKLWTLLYGNDGLVRIQAKSGDRFWICSELACEGLLKGGWKGRAISPADFGKDAVPFTPNS